MSSCVCTDNKRLCKGWLERLKRSLWLFLVGGIMSVFFTLYIFQACWRKSKQFLTVWGELWKSLTCLCVVFSVKPMTSVVRRTLLWLFPGWLWARPVLSSRPRLWLSRVIDSRSRPHHRDTHWSLGSIRSSNTGFHLVLVSRTWSPRGWWTSSSGNPLKALEKMAQVRFLSPLRWEEAALAWWEPGFVASCVERRVHSLNVLEYPQPYSDSGKTALPFTPLGSIALPTRWGFECPFSSPRGSPWSTCALLSEAGGSWVQGLAQLHIEPRCQG